MAVPIRAYLDAVGIEKIWNSMPHKRIAVSVLEDGKSPEMCEKSAKKLAGTKN